MNRRAFARIKAFLIITGLVFLDQISKYLAVIFLKSQPSFTVIPKVLELCYVENRGAAWGLLSGFAAARYLFVALAAAAVVLLASSYVRITGQKLLSFLFLVLAAGAAGNAIDRFFLGYVIDFIYISLIDFPVFNIADCYITVSAACFLLF